MNNLNSEMCPSLRGERTNKRMRPRGKKTLNNAYSLNMALFAHSVLCSDFPDVDDERLALLEAELMAEVAALNASSMASTSAAYPLCREFVAGAAHGAAKRHQDDQQAEVSPNSVPGLIARAAPASRFATIYAHGSVLRACALLTSSSESALAMSLTRYDMPPPTVALESSLAEVIPNTGFGGGSGGGGDEDDDGAAVAAPLDEGEVWAAEPDDDEEAYEPMELPASPPPRTSLGDPAVVAAVELPSRAQVLERLCHLLGTLTHDPLAALPPGGWERLKLGETLRRALSVLRPDSAPGPMAAPPRPWWMHVEDSAAAAAAAAVSRGEASSCEAGGSMAAAGVVSGTDVTLALASSSLLRTATASLTSLLRDHLLHQPAACVAELGPTLACLPPVERASFLASLVAADTPLSAARTPSDAWRVLDEAVRAELTPLLERVSDYESKLSAPVAPLFGGGSSAQAAVVVGAAGGGAAERAAQLHLDSALSLLRWYIEPPPAERRKVGHLLLSAGAPQLLARLVLPSHGSSRGGAALKLQACWEWLLAACSRGHFAEVLAFVGAIPAFRGAVRSSEHLSRRRAQQALWLLLLLPTSSAASSASPTASASASSSASTKASDDLAEATIAVQSLLSVGDSQVPSQRCEALAHALELVHLLNTAGGVMRDFLTGASAAPMRAALDAFRAHAMAAVKAAQAAAGAGACKGAEDGKGGKVSGGEPAADGVEKEGELLARAAAGLKELSQRLNAPGKAD